MVIPKKSAKKRGWHFCSAAQAKVAGAKTITMSLWKVNDEATQKLMTAFYENWLTSLNKLTAFRAAQQTLKSKYMNPYYWGGRLLWLERNRHNQNLTIHYFESPFHYNSKTFRWSPTS